MPETNLCIPGGPFPAQHENCARGASPPHFQTSVSGNDSPGLSYGNLSLGFWEREVQQKLHGEELKHLNF